MAGRFKLAPAAPGTVHDPALDGLRAVAVLAVVAFHAAPGRLPGGWAGVEMFFVLSGFLITRLVIREIDATGRLDVARFYRRRALRIVPALAVMLAGVGLFAAMLGPAAAATGTAELFAASFTMNWCRAFGWAADGALGHSWSLAIEEQFYLLWPPLLLAAGARRRIALASVLTIASTGWRCWLVAHGAAMDRTYNGLDTHAEPLLIGALLAMTGGARSGRAVPRTAATLAVAASAGFALVVAPRWAATQAIGSSIAALASAGLIACAGRPGWLRRALGRAPLVAVGRRSYGIYLWHFPLLILGPPHLPLALGTAVPLAATALLAALSWRFVERPFLALKDRERSMAADGLAPGPA